MKATTPLLITGGFILSLIIILIWATSFYNSFVVLDEEVNAQWAKVESAYQRRFDLIPNLVETVKGVADFEKETYTAITEARSRWQVSENVDQKIGAAQEAQSALARLLVSVENYPQLKANQNFLNLQAQLEGTENRINVERNRYNDAVKLYNQKIRKFPARFFAGAFGFAPRESFSADDGAETAVKVDFS